MRVGGSLKKSIIIDVRAVARKMHRVGLVFVFALAFLSLPRGTAGQATVTLEGQTYQLQQHPRVLLDGPAGSFSASLRNTSSSGKANLNNPAYAALRQKVSDFKRRYQFDNAAAGSANNYMQVYNDAALRWFADGDQASLKIAIWGINHIEQVVPQDSFGCTESNDECQPAFTPADLSSLSDSLAQFAQTYSLVRSYLTPEERKNFAGKVLNDNDPAHNGIGGSAVDPNVRCANWLSRSSWDSSKNFCGFVWLLKHSNYAPVMVAGGSSHYAVDYAPSGGRGDVFPHAQSETLRYLHGDIAIGLALADDDPRAQTLVGEAFNYYHTWYWSYAKSSWTGVTHGGPDSSSLVDVPMSAGIALMIRNSVVRGPDLIEGVYLSRVLPYKFYQHASSATGGTALAGVRDSSELSSQSQADQLAVLSVLALYPIDVYAPYAYGLVRNSFGNFDAGNLLAFNNGDTVHQAFEFYDPAARDSHLGGLTTQFLFRETDYAQCIAKLGANACFAGTALHRAVSKNDWTGSATTVAIQAGHPNFNHVLSGDDSSFGSYSIFKNGVLVAASGLSDASENGSGRLTPNVSLDAGEANHFLAPGAVRITRWAGTDPNGDPQSRFAYAMMDGASEYNSSVAVAHMLRHVIHFKAAGTQDFVISYDDIATSGGTYEKAFWSYELNGLGTAAVTVGASDLRVTNTQAGSKLMTQFVPVAGTNSLALTSDGSEASTGDAYRVYLCASNDGATCNSSATNAEWIAVHKPVANLGPSMDPVEALTTVDSNWRGVEIMGNSPKVALFARGGLTFPGTSFTANYGGSAQILIAGLTPGTYTVLRNGSVILSGQIVSDGDDTLYFESPSGTFSLNQVQTAPQGGSTSQHPDFAITSSSASQQVAAGSRTTYNVNVSAVSGFVGTVAMIVTGLPEGASARFAPSLISNSGSSVLTIATTSRTAGGNYTITIAGVSGATTRPITVTLVIVGKGSKSINSAAASPAAVATSGTVVYLPAPGAPTTYFVTGATTGTPIAVSISGAAPADGTPVWIRGVNGQACANGFWVTAGASGSSFNLTYMYYGGNANGSAANCTGSYTGGGTVQVLAAYPLTSHPRVLLDGPTGPLTQSLLNTSSNGKSNVSNPPYAAMMNAYNTLVATPYTSADVDSQSSGSNGNYFGRFAAACLIWQATKNATASTVCDWGINHIEQFFGPPDNFYCNGSTQCGNWNNSSVMDYGSFKSLDILHAYSVYHDQLTPAERATFANKLLNDNDYLHNGLGMPGAPTGSCANRNDNPWAAGDCGFTFLMRHLAYSPPISPGQESHYTSDYTSSTQAGVSVGVPSPTNVPNQNLTDAKLYGYILAGLALADDDPRAQMLLTQAYSFWYQWYWAWAESGWTGFTQAASRYTCYRIHPYNTEIVLAVKNSTGLDVSKGVYLQRQLAYYPFLTRPDVALIHGPTESWGTGYGACDNPTDATTAPLAATSLFSSDPLIPYVNYWYGKTFGSYNTSGWLAPSGNLVYTLRPYVFMAPGAPQTDPSGSLPTQYAFINNDYSQCTAALGTSQCYPNQGFDHAISKSDWGTAASSVFQRAGWLTSQVDHYCENQGLGCDTISYHIYRNGYLLAPNGGDGSPGGSADNTIQLGGSDNNYRIPSYGQISRWGSTNPSGDSLSRYAYWMVDASNIFTSSMGVTRAHRHVVHFKKSATQDYVVSYDDVASGANQIESLWHYPSAPAINALTAAYTNGSASRIVSSFLPVSGQIAPVALGDGIGICASSNGSSCNASATTGEWIAVHLPSTNVSATMPTISQNSCTGTGGNCTVTEIRDSSSPKVAVFARQGALLLGASFTTTHNGTAQYLIAGLSPGAYNVTVNGSTALNGVTVANGDNTLYFESVSGNVLVTQGVPLPDFSIAASPSSQQVTAGGSTTYNATVGALSGFTGAVSLGVSGLPSGASGSFAPATVLTSGSSVLTITTSASTAAGTYTLTLTGTSGSNVHATIVTLVVSPVAQPDFTVVASPNSQQVTAGASTTYNLNVGAVSGFTGTVSLAVVGLPSGTSGSFSPAAISTSGSSVLSVTSTASTAAGTYTLTITGTSGTAQHTATVTLVVAAVATPDFMVAASPSSQQVTAGGSTTYNATIGALSGFTGAVSLGVSGLPSGASGSFAPATVATSGSSVLTITISASTAAGTYTLTFTGTSGSTVHSATATLSVTAAGANVTVAVNPGSATLSRGGSVQISVTMTSSSTMTSPAFSCSGLPAYASCQVATSSMSSNGQSATSTVTLSIANQLSSLQEPGNLHLVMAGLSATGFGLFGLVMFTGNRRQRAGLVLVAVVVVCVVSLAGCAGLVSSTTPPTVRFSFLVTGTAHENGTTATNSATVSITVN